MEQMKTTEGEFSKYCEERLKELLGMGSEKGSEYAGQEDRFANFRHGSDLRRTIPEDYLYGLVAKHITALQDFIERLKAGQCMRWDQWKEKTGDVIVYMLILEGLVKERFQAPIILSEGIGAADITPGQLIRTKMK